MCQTLKDAGFEDDDWDEKDLVQKSYKKQGLKRYKLDIKLLNRLEKVDKESEEVSSTNNMKDGASAFEALTDHKIKIKIEAPEVLALQQEKTVLKSGEVRLSGSLQDARRIKAQIAALPDSTVGTATKFHFEFLFQTCCEFCLSLHKHQQEEP